MKKKTDEPFNPNLRIREATYTNSLLKLGKYTTTKSIKQIAIGFTNLKAQTGSFLTT